LEALFSYLISSKENSLKNEKPIIYNKNFINLLRSIERSVNTEREYINIDTYTENEVDLIITYDQLHFIKNILEGLKSDKGESFITKV
jgi:hypothetical protein